MNGDIIHEIDADRGQVLDAQRLIEAVRGSQAARVLFELRQWLPGHNEQREGGTALASAAPLNP